MTKREWLKEARNAKGHTLMTLAKEIGCSFSHISDIENGRRRPSGPMAYKLANALGFEMTKFFEGSETA